MKKFLLLILTLLFIPANAQELNKDQLDSVYNAFLKMRGFSTGIQLDKPETEIVKCGLGIISQIKFNLEKFSIEKQQLLKSFLDRPARDTSIVSPSGFFRIHHDTSGSEVPQYIPYDSLLSPAENALTNAKQVGIALDSSYNFEVNSLGYPSSPPDNGFGGDNLYDVYISNLGNLYGYTEKQTNIGNNKWTSFIVIDDDFPWYPPQNKQPIDAARVTVAHEFHHAIQMGNYIYRDNDLFFYEMTSTSMEEFVYDDVNDYYAYMSHFFNNPGKAFGIFPGLTVDGYDLAVWNIFLKDKFGYDIIRRQWELLPKMRALEAIVTSLNNKGTSYGSIFNEFGVWIYFTNYKAIPGKYFEEALNYPSVRILRTLQLNSMPVNGQAKPTSTNFINFINVADTLTTIISNTDYVNGINNINADYGYEYTLSSESFTGSTKLTDNYFSRLTVDQPLFWADAEILNNQVVRLDSMIYPVNLAKDLYAYPNPFFYNKNNNYVEILVDPENASEVDLNVYTSAMELVYSSTLPVQNNNFGRKVLRWDIRSLNKTLASGVYIYAVKTGDETSKGKLVIFNE